MNDKPLQVDELLSFAHRVGDEVRVTLRLTDGNIEAGPARVRLVNDRRRFEVDGAVTSESDGTVLTFTAPQDKLRRAVWRVALRPANGERFQRAQARLLATPAQPVALLPGPTPATRMTPPAPRPKVSVARRVAAQLPDPAQRVLRRGRAVVASRGRR